MIPSIKRVHLEWWQVVDYISWKKVFIILNLTSIKNYEVRRFIYFKEIEKTNLRLIYQQPNYWLALSTSKKFD